MAEEQDMKAGLETDYQTYEDVIIDKHYWKGFNNGIRTEKFRESKQQQPCEDAISRQAVNTLVDELARAISDERCCISRGRSTATIMQDILDLPSVTPQPKAVLYSGDGYADGYMVYDMAECPNCGYEYEEGDKDWKLPFCPNCGQSLNWESEG